MINWIYLKEKLYTKIYCDLNIIWPKIFPLNEESKSIFFQLNESLIKDLFDYLDPNYKKFMVDLLLKLQEIYELPLADKDTVYKRLGIKIDDYFEAKIYNENEFSKIIKSDINAEKDNLNRKNASQSEKCQQKAANEWNLINKYECQKQLEIDNLKKHQYKKENLRIQEELNEQIKFKNELKKLNKEKETINEIKQNSEIQNQILEEKELNQKKKQIEKIKSNEELKELEEEKWKKKTGKEDQKKIDKEKLNEQDLEFSKYHSQSNIRAIKKKKDILEKENKNNNINNANHQKGELLNNNKNSQQENSKTEEKLNKEEENIYEILKTRKADYENWLKEKKIKKAIDQDEDKQYVNNYTMLLESQEKGRRDYQLKMFSKCLPQQFIQNEDLPEIKKKVNIETNKFVRDQIIDKIKSKKEGQLLEKKLESIKVNEIKRELEEKRKKLAEDKKQKMSAYHNELSQQIQSKQISGYNFEGMNSEEKLLNMDLLVKARESLTKKFIA